MGWVSNLMSNTQSLSVTKTLALDGRVESDMQHLMCTLPELIIFVFSILTILANLGANNQKLNISSLWPFFCIVLLMLWLEYFHSASTRDS